TGTTIVHLVPKPKASNNVNIAVKNFPSPRAAEQRALDSILNKNDDPKTGWSRLCHTLLASNEFIFVN
ncbi:MAG: hypothetical protein AAF492_24840, partial [Verrucomicrobiota bacterium]